MKPVIKKQTHYNLLLMRDDSEARTFRIHSTTLRVLLVLLFILVAGGAGGIYGGVHFFTRYLTLARQHEAQEKELSEMRLQLERLVNLESLIVASNNGSAAAKPLAKNEEVGVSAPANRSLAAAPEGVSDPAAPATPAGTVPGLPPGQDAAQDASPSPAESQHPAYPSISSPESPLRIGNFNGRAGGAQRVRINYELSTTPSDEQRTVSGSVRYTAVFTNGEKLDLALQDVEGTRFAIARMKPMQASARLPQGYQTDQIEKIELFVETTDGVVFHDAFDFAK